MPNPTMFDLLSADKPLEDPAQDRLGYAPLAQTLTKALINIPAKDGFVVGVYGEWGTGKSTMLNFIKHYLDQYPKSKRPIIVRFNPWWFPGQEGLARHLFSEISDCLFPKRFRWFRKLFRPGLRGSIAKLLDAGSALTGPAAPYAKAIGKVVQPTQRDIIDAKRQLRDILEKKEAKCRVRRIFQKLWWKLLGISYHQKILIIIDDIDRLAKEEIKLLIGVVKTVADLPNTIYVLAFSHKIVCEALNEMQTPLSGEEYLDKIIQLPIHLPLPPRHALYQIMLDKLGDIFADMTKHVSEEGPFTNTAYNWNKWQEHIMHFIDSPRHLVRLSNTLCVTYSALRGEVDPVDFIIIETLRIFCPPVYNVIRTNPDMFVGAHPATLSTIPGYNPLQEKRAFHDSWLQEINENDKETIKILLAYCFPILDAVFFGAQYSPETLSVYGIRNRVSAIDQFDRYFRFAITGIDISNAEMRELVGLASDEHLFVTKLLQFAKDKPQGVLRVHLLLSKMQDYLRDTPSEGIVASIVRAFLKVGDEWLRLEQNEVRDIFALSINAKLFNFNRAQLKIIKQTERFELIRAAINGSDALETIVFHITEFGHELGKYGSLRTDIAPLLTSDFLAEIENLALEKIYTASRDDSFLQTPYLYVVMHYWFQLAPEQAKNWFVEHTQEDLSLISILKKFVIKVRNIDGTEEIYLNYDHLKNFCRPTDTVNRIERILENPGLDGNNKKVLEQIKKRLISEQS